MGNQKSHNLSGSRELADSGSASQFPDSDDWIDDQLLDQHETPLVPSRIGPDPHNGAVVIGTRCHGDGRAGIAQARKLRT